MPFVAPVFCGSLDSAGVNLYPLSPEAHKRHLQFRKSFQFFRAYPAVPYSHFHIQLQQGCHAHAGAALHNRRLHLHANAGLGLGPMTSPPRRQQHSEAGLLKCGSLM